MEKFNPKRLSRILLLTLVLTGCATATLQTPVTTIIPFTSAPKPTSTKLLPTLTQKPEPIWTLPATLSAQDATFKVNELLQTNRGCRLPCWWGITPGRTRWEEARNILFPLAKSVYDSYGEEGEFFPGLLAYYSADGNRFFEQDYTVRNGVVQAIKIKVPYKSSFAEPKGILTSYGMPDEVYIGANEYAPGADREQYFSVVLYYTKQRIFAYYGGGFQPVQFDPLLRICFPEIEYAELHLWGPTYSFGQTRDSVFEEHGNKFQSLETVTELTIDDFFKIFTNSAEVPCFETPAEKWLQ